VLLLDDATHAFSSVQQREFFEIFRCLKSRTVSSKAAVIPGITSYSPNFLLGHDTQLVEVWHQPEEDGYLEFMTEVIKRRLPPDLMNSLVKKGELVDYLALAAFGLPRSFLFMISLLLGIEEESSKKPSISLAKQAISTHCSIIRLEFQSLSAKLPQYSQFIEMGGKLENAKVNHLKRYNQSRYAHKKTVVVGIAEPVEPALSQILALLEYAGIIRPMGVIHRGNKLFYRKYALHYAIDINENSLSLGHNYALSTLITALTKRDPHAVTLSRGIGLLGRDFQMLCALDLPPCQNCGTARVYEEAKFCVECGRRLLKFSIYEELLKGTIDKLPLPKKKIEALKKQTSIRTVEDILLDEENIMQINGIGAFWANRIHNAALEFVGG
jgi:hypothetical protein